MGVCLFLCPRQQVRATHSQEPGFLGQFQTGKVPRVVLTKWVAMELSNLDYFRPSPELQLFYKSNNQTRIKTGPVQEGLVVRGVLGLVEPSVAHPHGGEQCPLLGLPATEPPVFSFRVNKLVNI